MNTKTKNGWWSVDAHFQNGAVSVSLLLIKAANLLEMHNGELITLQIPYLQEQKSVTLWWYSFISSGSVHVTFSFAYKAANMLFIHNSEQITVQVLYWQDENSLTPGWHFNHGSVSVLLLSVKAANKLVMHNGELITFQLPYLQDQQWLALCWRSFSEWGSVYMAVSFAYEGCEHVGYA
jgi:hypothetical protein